MNTPQSFQEFGNDQNLNYVAMATVEDERAKAHKIEDNYSNVLSSQNAETKPINKDGTLKDIINEKEDNDDLDKSLKSKEAFIP